MRSLAFSSILMGRIEEAQDIILREIRDDWFQYKFRVKPQFDRSQACGIALACERSPEFRSIVVRRLRDRVRHEFPHRVYYEIHRNSGWFGFDRIEAKYDPRRQLPENQRRCPSPSNPHAMIGEGYGLLYWLVWTGFNDVYASAEDLTR